MTQLTGYLPRWLTKAKDDGPLPGDTRLDYLTLVLARPPEVEAAFQRLLLEQQDVSSPRYHHWLGPQQAGEMYGADRFQIAAITTWLNHEGLSVDTISANRMFITFSGNVGDIARAFSTEIHVFAEDSIHDGPTRYSLVREPSLPADIAPFVLAVAGLSQQLLRASVRQLPITLSMPGPGNPTPRVDLGNGMHWILPADFTTLYDIQPAYDAGIDGAGERVAIIGASRVSVSDISNFEVLAGLSATQPTTLIVPGYSDPGTTGTGAGGTGDDNQNESTLDVDRVIGTARGSPVDLVLVRSLTDAEVLAAINYAMGTLNDPILSISFGRCEAQATASDSAAFNAAFAAGQAQGISIFVASGDSEVAGCANPGSPYSAGIGASINLLCTPSVTCVGGTQFSDIASPSTYWSTLNGAGDGSAIGYIPEGVWNEPALSGSGYEILGGGGGPSIFYPKPAWQTMTGVPNDNARDTPDISLSASAHNAYVACTAFDGAGCVESAGRIPLAGLYGTSAAAPGMAAIAAMLDQKLKGRQGNINSMLYKLAGVPSNNAIHDATPASSGVATCDLTVASTCNTSTPGSNALTGGLAGFAVTPGYDEATGLGSVDVTNLLAAALAAALPAAAATTSTLVAGATSVSTIQSVLLTDSITTATAGSPTGTVQFSVDGTPQGNPVALVGARVSQSFRFTAGSHRVIATYSGDSDFAPSTSAPVSISVVALTPTVTLTINPSTITTAGATSLGFAVSGPAGAPVPTGSVVLGYGSTSVSSFSLAGGVASGALGGLPAGSYPLFASYPGDAAYGAASSSISSLVVTPTFGFTLSVSPGSLTLLAGASSGNTATLTYASINGFAGQISQSCTVTYAGSAPALMPKCTLASANINLVAGGIGTSILTVTSTSPNTRRESFATRAAPMLMVFLLPLAGWRRVRGLIVIWLAGLVLVGAGGCGSGVVVPFGTSVGTAPGSYSIQVVASSGSISVGSVMSLTIR